MDIVKRALVVIAFWSFFLLGKIDAQHFSSEYKCQEPEEGLWQLEEHFPAGAFKPELLPPGTNNTDYVLAVKAKMKFTKALKGVYKGAGVSEAYLPFPAKDVPLKFIGMFDKKSCMMTGTLFNKALNAAATFRWYCLYGIMMSGPYVVTVDGDYPFPHIGFHNVTFLE